ncbi:MAG: BBP7 family outer membrane beta-barrel protein [Pirellulaceae bacterium]
MSITRITPVLVGLATALALVSNASGELLDPLAFPPVESDFQVFAPADIDWYGGSPKHKTGWFATYDRVYMNVQRPEETYQGHSSVIGDFTWGNRVDLGFFDDDSKGWTATIWHIDGPNEDDIVVTERLNRTADGSPQEERVFPIRDNNNRLTGARDYLVTNSINVADMSGFELNRTWLWKTVQDGGRLQPFAGFRYTRFEDFHQRQTYTRYDDDGFTIDPIPPSSGTTATAERLTSLDASVLNDMVGGQLGIHWDKDYRRWNFSGDVKFFAMQNFQSWDQTTSVETTLEATDDPPGFVTMEETGEAQHTSEFVWGGEVRVEAAYRLTRDLSLRSGFEFMDFGQGIGRGIDFNNNTSQDVIMYGVTMGVTWNR